MNLKDKLTRLSSAGPGSRPQTLAPTIPSPSSHVPLPHELTPPWGDQRADKADPSHQSRASTERRAKIDKLRAMLRDMVAKDQVLLRQQAAASEAQPAHIESLPGAARETAHGPIHVVEHDLEPAHCHGKASVAEALRVRPGTVAKLALDPLLAQMAPKGMLLLDTETTGLCGGAGVLAFLVGMAWFEDQSLHVEQLFLKQPGQEGPMLKVLADRLSRASVLVTFNGKSYDWPLLRTRFVMARLEPPQPPAHLDLLHLARRVYKRRLSEVRLVNVEAQVLGMRRERDIDGAEVPALYLEYLRGGDGGGLARVIEHNANDLVALAAILGKLCSHYDTLHPDDDPQDHLGYATVAERARDLERAQVFAMAAADGGGAPSTTVDALLLAARLARKQRAPQQERQLLLLALDATAQGGAGRAEPAVHLALAKLYEHRLKDLLQALEHARCTTGAETEEMHEKRLARLTRRLTRKGIAIPLPVKKCSADGDLLQPAQ